MNVSKQPTKALSVGTIVGGRTTSNRGWIDAVNELTNLIINARDGVTSALNINVEFHIPGNLIAPGYAGVRPASFRTDDSLLKVQVALPAQAPDDPRSALMGYLWAALDAADVWAVGKRKNFDTAALRGIVGSIEASASQDHLGSERPSGQGLGQSHE